jgi:hypothetical protein
MPHSHSLFLTTVNTCGALIGASSAWYIYNATKMVTPTDYTKTKSGMYAHHSMPNVQFSSLQGLAIEMNQKKN